MNFKNDGTLTPFLNSGDVVKDLFSNPQPLNSVNPLAMKTANSLGLSPQTPNSTNPVLNNNVPPPSNYKPVASTSTPSVEEQAIIDQPSTSAAAITESSTAVEETLDTVTKAEEAVETPVEAAEVAEGPIGDAKVAGQLAGQFLNMGLNSLGESQANSQLQSNLATMHGVGTNEIAQSIYASDKSSLGLQNAIGSAGAFLGGPIGALLGRGIAALIPTTPNLDVANSNYGKFNPQDASINTAQSQSSAQLNVDPTSS